MHPCPPCVRPRNPRATAILEAARTCFERYGFHAASMSRIAEEAGISVGHIYRYFANKEAVVAAIVADDLEEISRDIDQLGGSPEETVERILRSFESSRSRRRTVLRLEVLSEGARNPKIAAMIGEMEARVRERMKRALTGALRSRQVKEPLSEAEVEMRTSLIALLMEGFQLRAFQEGEAMPKGLTDQVRKLLMQTFSSAPITIGAIDRHQPCAGG